MRGDKHRSCFSPVESKTRPGGSGQDGCAGDEPGAAKLCGGGFKTPILDAVAKNPMGDSGARRKVVVGLS
jgi:hypothetical protein